MSDPKTDRYESPPIPVSDSTGRTRTVRIIAERGHVTVVPPPGPSFRMTPFQCQMYNTAMRQACEDAWNQEL